MRRRVPDRRRGLRAAARRRAAAQAARACSPTYREAGGARAIVLLHDEPHGAPLIEALARHGDGLPANVLPLAVNEVTQVGLEAVAAAFAYGASALRFLTARQAAPRRRRALPRRSRSPNRSWPASASARAASPPSRPTIRSRSATSLRAIDAADGAPRPAAFHAGRREARRAAACAARTASCGAGAGRYRARCPRARRSARSSSTSRAARFASRASPPARPARCPTIRSARCCASPRMPACSAGCARRRAPRRSSRLKPQLDFRAATARARVLKEEEPFCCIRCGKPFGVKSSVERVAAKLEGKHWMFQNSAKRLDVIKMCADCRVIAMTEENFDPFGAPARPEPAHHGRLSARAGAKGEGRASPRSELGSTLRCTVRHFVAFARKSVSALRSSAEPMRCSGILVPGV